MVVVSPKFCVIPGKKAEVPLDKMLHDTRAALNMIMDTETPISLTEMKPKSESLKPSPSLH
jgi:hypothetical protein